MLLAGLLTSCPCRFPQFIRNNCFMLSIIRIISILFQYPVFVTLSRNLFMRPSAVSYLSGMHRIIQNIFYK